ncbi:MAG TPA: GNAT family N-acetyltransferase [Motilibacteraceae bacterium]|nr:GNAT family N-acetyltransferase [Motilibacteraceae bacterium]
MSLLPDVGGLRVVPGDVADAAALRGLRDEAARWQTARGITQWRVGDVPLERYETQLSAGEWHVLRSPETGVPVAGLRLLWEDPVPWGERPPDAAYVHHLVVARSLAGRRVGRALLNWAGDQARACGRAFLRLDCMAANEQLRAHYRSMGFAEVGEHVFEDPAWYPVMLFERPVSGS